MLRLWCRSAHLALHVPEALLSVQPNQIRRLPDWARQELASLLVKGDPLLSTLTVDLVSLESILLDLWQSWDSEP
jgi:hypothetical protein